MLCRQSLGGGETRAPPAGGPGAACPQAGWDLAGQLPGGSRAAVNFAGRPPPLRRRVLTNLCLSQPLLRGLSLAPTLDTRGALGSQHFAKQHACLGHLHTPAQTHVKAGWGFPLLRAQQTPRGRNLVREHGPEGACSPSPQVRACHAGRLESLQVSGSGDLGAVCIAPGCEGASCWERGVAVTPSSEG